MRTNTQRLRYRFPSHAGSCWTQVWHLTNRQMIAGTVVYAKQFHCKRPSWCRRYEPDKKAEERTIRVTPTGTKALGLHGRDRKSRAVSRQNVWWHQLKSSANYKIVVSFLLRKCSAQWVKVHDTDCNLNSTSRALCQHALELAPWSTKLVDSVVILVVTLALMAIARVFLSTNPFVQLP